MSPLFPSTPRPGAKETDLTKSLTVEMRVMDTCKRQKDLNVPGVKRKDKREWAVTAIVLKVVL